MLGTCAARGLRVRRRLARLRPHAAATAARCTPGSDPAEVGDEPLLIAARRGVPVFVAPRRAEAARALLRRASRDTQVIVSDDGLQHHALARDIEICVFDDRGIGNGWLLPAGPLREPWPRPADLVLPQRRAPGICRASRARGGWPTHAVRARRHAGCPLAALRRHGRCAALAGIAKPDAFFDMLRARGPRRWRPHLRPARPPRLRRTPLPAVPQRMPLLCTEKDAVKLWRMRPDAWAVPLEVAHRRRASGQRSIALLDAKLSSPHGPQAA